MSCAIGASDLAQGDGRMKIYNANDTKRMTVREIARGAVAFRFQGDPVHHFDAVSREIGGDSDEAPNHGYGC